MHSPLRYAADKLLQQLQDQTLEQFIEEAQAASLGDQVAAVMLADKTGGVIVIDRRTMHNWLRSE